MPWFKVDDNLAFHQKALRAGNSAMGLWVRAGSYCAQQLTDGFVAADIVAALGTRAEARRLVAASLWLEVDGGYQFWQWNEDGRQPTRTEVEQKRKEARERQRRAREVRAESQRDNQRDARRDTGRSTAVSHASPDPTRPDPLTTEDQDLGGQRPETLRAADATEHTPIKPSDARCSAHRGDADPGPCNGCRRERERAERKADAAAERDRRAWDEAVANCPDCHGSHWREDPDGTPVEPPKRCTHPKLRRTA